MLWQPRVPQKKSKEESSEYKIGPLDQRYRNLQDQSRIRTQSNLSQYVDYNLMYENGAEHKIEAVEKVRLNLAFIIKKMEWL